MTKTAKMIETEITKATGLAVTRDRSKALVLPTSESARICCDGIDIALEAIPYWCDVERFNIDNLLDDRRLLSFAHADGELWVADRDLL